MSIEAKLDRAEALSKEASDHGGRGNYYKALTSLDSAGPNSGRQVRVWPSQDRHAIIPQPGNLIGGGRLSDDLEEPVLFSRRGWEQQAFQRGPGRHVFPILHTRPCVLLTESLDVGHQDRLGSLALDPIVAALVPGRAAEDRFKRQIEEAARSFHQDRGVLLWPDLAALLHESVAHADRIKVFFVGDNGLSERGGFALEGRTTETQVFVPLAATCERIAIELFVHQMAPSSAILETCLSVQNLARAKEFYADLFGYPVMRSDERLCAFDIGGKQVLLLFRRGSDPQGTVLPCGVIPPHGTTGVSHIGFRIPAESLAAWKARLGERGIAIESEFQWPLGGTSIYFRDPDRHLLELLTPVCGQAIDPAGERDDPANGRGVPCGTGKPARTIS